jgi:hypothetical protein
VQSQRNRETDPLAGCEICRRAARCLDATSPPLSANPNRASTRRTSSTSQARPAASCRRVKSDACHAATAAGSTFMVMTDHPRTRRSDHALPRDLRRSGDS